MGSQLQAIVVKLHGAAVVVLAKRSTAIKLGLTIMAKFCGFAVEGCQPELMGIGPI